MSWIGRRAKVVFFLVLLFLSSLLAGCSALQGDSSRRQRPPNPLQARVTDAPLVGDTPTPFVPPPASPVEGEGGETPAPSPTPPTTPGASPTPITPQPAEATPTPIPAEQPPPGEDEPAAPAVVPPVQVEVVLVTPASADQGLAQPEPGQPAAGGAFQVTVVVATATPEGNGMQAPAAQETATGESNGEAPEQETAQPPETDAAAADQEAAPAAEDEPPAASDEAPAEEAEGEAAEETEETPGAVAPALIAVGAEIYDQRCAACHGPDGIGRRGYFPDLRGNPFVTVDDPTGVVDVILHGRNLMPPFRSYLSDEEVAAVTSFLRAAWGHEAAPVSPEDVASVRRNQRGQNR